MPPAGPPCPPSRPAGDSDRLRGPEAARLSPRRLPAAWGALGCQVPAPAAAARDPELLQGWHSGSRPAPGPPCESPARRQKQGYVLLMVLCWHLT